DAYSEAWFESCLRKGHPDVPFDDLQIRLVPVFKKETSSRCAGFALEAINPGGETTRREFGLTALEHVANRAAERLVAAGALQSGDNYYYELVVDGGPGSTAPSADLLGGASFTVTSKHSPLAYLKVPLLPLLDRARHVGNVGDGWYHVFYTK